MDANEIIRVITKKAWEDDTFKQRLLSDPKAVVKEEAGIDIPDSVKVTVHEWKPGELYFVLPVNPKAAAELSDSELDQVAGGVSTAKQGGLEPAISEPLFTPGTLIAQDPLIAPAPGTGYNG